jgi:hypothetical protein
MWWKLYSSGSVYFLNKMFKLCALILGHPVHTIFHKDWFRRSNVFRGDIHRDSTHRQQGDLISLLLFFQSKETRVRNRLVASQFLPSCLWSAQLTSLEKIYFLNFIERNGSSLSYVTFLAEISCIRARTLPLNIRASIYWSDFYCSLLFVASRRTTTRMTMWCPKSNDCSLLYI